MDEDRWRQTGPNTYAGPEGWTLERRVGRWGVYQPGAEYPSYIAPPSSDALQATLAADAMLAARKGESQ